MDPLPKNASVALVIFRLFATFFSLVGLVAWVGIHYAYFYCLDWNVCSMVVNYTGIRTKYFPLMNTVMFCELMILSFVTAILAKEYISWIAAVPILMWTLYEGSKRYQEL
jgi:hypothetical protein